MALFFDSAWFDQKLTARGATRAELAAALGLAPEAVDEIFKDQRELGPAEVEILAQFVGEDAETVADKAGVATPRPSTAWLKPSERAHGKAAAAAGPTPDQDGQSIQEIKQQLARIEEKLDRLLASLPRP